MPVFLLASGAIVLWLAYKFENKSEPHPADVKGKFLGGLLLALGLGMLLRRWFK